MELYVYSDESGVFDKVHNNYYIYGGLIFLDKNTRDNAARRYIGAEHNIAKYYSAHIELKACTLKNRHKASLYTSIKHYIKFGAIIEQQRVNNNIFASKKSKQRYLDYVYKIALKNAFLEMGTHGHFKFNEIENINIFVDEHTTATDGMYELREGLLQEFKHGTFNYTYNKFYSPIFSNLKDVALSQCNSAKKPLIRAADILANRLYYSATKELKPNIQTEIYIKRFP